MHHTVRCRAAVLSSLQTVLLQSIEGLSDNIRVKLLVLVMGMDCHLKMRGFTLHFICLLDGSQSEPSGC
jgi:hypothetical protein